ncbi:hypothetical protein RhiirC2_727148 [Rhizophagus irregularis]|uniref:Uncharacterized protein n=1 Tax=Rhizophagus irregularis TaxID=588596 RepID=A0A2N1P016_9GLOM|nr:hypothetical protein RhiirC2_727148 [Rhizophagus irregularis]
MLVFNSVWEVRSLVFNLTINRTLYDDMYVFFGWLRGKVFANFESGISSTPP